jgi:hypothetical protein
VILALDPGTTTGWAAGKPGGTPEWGVRKFQGKTTGEVLGMYRHWINQRCYDLKPRLIVFEAPYVPRPNSPLPMNVLTLRRLLGIAGTIEACAWELRIRCNEATPLEIARFFLGTTKLKREQKKAATIEMCRRYGWDVDDNDDAADSLALWHLAEFTYAPEIASRRGSGPLFIPENRTPPDPSRSEASLFPPPEGGASDGRVAR